jgi:hypothetical protein
MDPNEEIRGAISDAFAAFEATGSAYGVVGAFGGRPFPLTAGSDDQAASLLEVSAGVEPREELSYISTDVARTVPGFSAKLSDAFPTPQCQHRAVRANGFRVSGRRPARPGRCCCV